MNKYLLKKIFLNLNKDSFRKVPSFLSVIFARKCFKFFEKYLKLHITPAHFYSPIPVTHELEPSIFNKTFDCTGIDWNLQTQLKNLDLFHSKYYVEYIPSANVDRFSQVDSFMLYSIIRERKPKVVIEVGSGESTRVSLAALELNEKEGHDFKFYAIEPYPPDFLRSIHNSNFYLIKNRLQDVDADFLSSADLLFIDSSHVSKIDSDVNYEILEIIPKLKTGAAIHWHDIMIPTNYWKRWIDDGNMFWNESYIVHAFMLFNTSYKILWASRYMQLSCPDELRKRLLYFKPEDENQQITSFWIEKIN